jgi:hypothetical protein
VENYFSFMQETILYWVSLYVRCDDFVCMTQCRYACVNMYGCIHNDESSVSKDASVFMRGGEVSFCVFLCMCVCVCVSMPLLYLNM